MKILTIHADFIEFEAKKKAFSAAEEGVEKGKRVRVEECLVVFSAVEKKDEENVAAVLQKYLQEIKNISQQVNAKTLVLYPYAHLSSTLSDPKVAEDFLKNAEQKLRAEKYTVFRAPFGWYKSFTISCKGHPLSELSRQFSAEETLSLKKEGKDEPFVFDEKKLRNDEKVLLTSALLVGKAVKNLHPTAEVTALGFYHNQAYVDVAGTEIHMDEVASVEAQACSELSRHFPIEKIAVQQITNALQKSMVQDIGKSAVGYSIDGMKVVPLYKDPFVGLDKVKALKILNQSKVYWKNNANNTQLTRVYVVGFDAAGKLEEFLKKKGEAESRSHLKIGKEMGLFVNSELVGPGLPLLAPKGMIIREEIISYLWELHKDKGYQKVWTPHIAKEQLYKTSGHWDKFGDELFKVKGKTDNFILKPMNCPHHMQIFDSFSFSYRDLPVRYFEPATIYRDEKSGQLLGLSRVRAITQDDGHLFCRVSQIKQEVAAIVSVIREFYSTLGMDKEYWVSLSVRGGDKSKYLGSDDVWEIAESSLEEAAKENKLNYKRIEGEAAFYGPKLDFLFKDSLGREWQLATIQCDFNLPERFNLGYMNEESKKERPVVIHRAISGSLERFMSVLIEHFAGKFPLWLSPVQMKIVTVNDRNIDFAKSVVKLLREQNIRVELDDRTESVGRKVRDAQLERANYIVTVGDKEVEKKVLAVRDREGAVKFDVSVQKFVTEVVEEVRERRL
ncbi:MAG: threonine--tRNA ligase [Nanoarchaeota archaeon]|nr:threonine--tRNA ligase [Nanoarchaeota archaeon]